MGNISEKIEKLLKRCQQKISIVLPSEIKKGEGMKMKGEGEELERVSLTWREFKAQKLSSARNKSKLLFGGIKKDYNNR